MSDAYLSGVWERGLQPKVGRYTSSATGGYTEDYSTNNMFQLDIFGRLLLCATPERLRHRFRPSDLYSWFLINQGLGQYALCQQGLQVASLHLRLEKFHIFIP